MLGVTDWLRVTEGETGLADGVLVSLIEGEGDTETEPDAGLVLGKL